MENYTHMGWLVLLVLLPLLPSYLLYRYLPSETHVTGPFRGLSLNLSGAFAQYFLTLIIASAIAFPKTHLSSSSVNEIWTLKGSVSVGESTDTLERAVITTSPPMLDVTPLMKTEDEQQHFIQQFKMHIPVKRGTSESEAPSVYIALSQYETVRVCLKPSGIDASNELGVSCPEVVPCEENKERCWRLTNVLKMKVPPKSYEY